MTTKVTFQKVTVSLPSELIEYVDEKAGQLGLGRSRLIADVLARWQAREEDELAAEGYRFYAQEASEFAAASLRAVSEALDHAG